MSLLPSILALLHVLGALSSIHAIMRARTSQGATAWAISLNTIPYLALPAYWVFGRSRFFGYTTARRGKLENVEGITREAIDKTLALRPRLSELAPELLVAERLAGLPFLGGNEVELLVDGVETFGSILEGVAAARRYVLVQFFTVQDDAIGREMKRALVEKARAGLKVCFLYDEVGSYNLPDGYRTELRAAGVLVYNFHSQKGPKNRFQLNFRNHRKIVVVDGRVAWLGGLNLSDTYLGRNPEFGYWRDTHLRLEGPAALAVQLSFVEDWAWATDEVPRLDWEPKTNERGERAVLIVPSGPADTFETTALLVVQAIHAARERLWIASPYFVPDAPVVAALQLAALRGVDVRLLIPEKPDHLGVHLAAFAYLDEVSRAGVRVYRYQRGFMHQKVLLIDEDAATVGTANLDNRSFRLNFEITALVADSGFAAEVEAMLERDFEGARVVEAGELARKPWWFRFASRVARLAAPLL